MRPDIAEGPGAAPRGAAVARPGDAAGRISLGGTLSIADANRIAAAEVDLELAREAHLRLEEGHARMLRCMREGATIYGVTTGFGPLADRAVPAASARVLQAKLIEHLATGVGARLGWLEARAVLVARLRCLLEGVSGASPRSAEALVAVLRARLAPVIPEKGTVGASGDLTPLAHMALSLMGRGPFLARDGGEVPCQSAFEAMGIAPLDLEGRDGLCLVNGTSAMTGIAVVNARRAGRLLDWGERLTAGLAELLRGRLEAWDPILSDLRPHPGQRYAAATLRTVIDGSARADPGGGPRPSAEALPRAPRPPQDAYTLRCAPQVLGACRDALAWHDSVVEIELNAVTDNPVFPDPGAHPRAPAVLHGGNFMGQHVGLAADCLSNAVIVAAGLAERQIARLTDERLNEGLPAFLHRGTPGLDSGLMGAQVTATALYAEMRSRAVPASIQSISTNGANQDVVSMGTVAARRTAEHLADAARVQAILALALAQGVDILDAQGEGGDAVSPGLRVLWRGLRRIAPPLAEDRPLSGEIEAVADWMRARSPAEEGAADA